MTAYACNFARLMATDESHFLTVGESHSSLLEIICRNDLLNRTLKGKLHQRLFRCLQKAIIDGVIQPKTRLPASRDVSRNTVLSACYELQAEGYLEARTGHGTWLPKVTREF